MSVFLCLLIWFAFPLISTRFYIFMCKSLFPAPFLLPSFLSVFFIFPSTNCPFNIKSWKELNQRHSWCNKREIWRECLTFLCTIVRVELALAEAAGKKQQNVQGTRRALQGRPSPCTTPSCVCCWLPGCLTDGSGPPLPVSRTFLAADGRLYYLCFAY